MLKERILQREIIDDLELSDPLIIENLKDMEFLNRWLGYNKRLIGGINRVKKKYGKSWKERKILIADLGCGSGDALRYMGDWMKRMKYDCQLIGVDGNEAIIDYGRKRSLNYPQIQYCVRDILLEDHEGNHYDVISLNNVCHHFSDCEMIHMLKKLKCSCRTMIINDLHRHYLAYWGIKLLSTVCRFSPLTKHDGPLSVRKGFKRRDLKNILESMESKDYEIRWTWVFRWQIIIWE